MTDEQASELLTLLTTIANSLAGCCEALENLSITARNVTDENSCTLQVEVVDFGKGAHASLLVAGADK